MLQKEDVKKGKKNAKKVNTICHQEIQFKITIKYHYEIVSLAEI